MKIRSRTRWLMGLALAAAVALVVGPAISFGVGTSYWVQTSETDFKAGTFDNVVATNLGDLKLSRAVKTLLEMNPRVSAVTALAEAPDGTIYAGTGPRGIVLKVKDGSTSTLTTIKDATHVFSVLVEKDGKLLLGTGGEHGRVLRVDPAKPDEKPVELFKADGVQYVWAIKQAEDGTIYAATGPKGQLFEIKPKEDGSGATQRVLLDSKENNLLSLAYDGKETLYVGTDPNGLVYRVNRTTGQSFVLFDAGEAEISALVLDKNGNLYAGTSEAREEPAVAMPTAPAAASAPSGRPEADAAGKPIDSKPPELPKPPESPKPSPGQPNPIPKAPAEEPKKSAEQTKPTEDGSKSEGTKPAEPAKSEAKPEAKSNESASETKPNEATAAPAPSSNPTTTGTARRPSPTNPPPGGGRPRPGPGGFAGRGGANATTGRMPQIEAPAAGQPKPDGNAVYRIDPDGFVTEVFRQRGAMVLSMVEREGTLLLGTGSEGLIYQVKPAADETVVLAKVDPKQVLSLLPAKDGTLYMGLANVGGIVSLTGGFAPEGTYTSVVLDATQISRFGNLRLSGSLPGDTTLTVSTRSGNVKEPTQSSWSPWTPEVPATEYVKIQSPPARFFQYRLKFTSKDGKATPVVEDVASAYQLPNLPPQIRSVRVVPQAEPINAADPNAPRVAAARRHQVGWEVADPNGDRLQFSLYFRQGSSGPWILMKDELTTNAFEWDTRTVADGKYEVKVVASDAPSNAPGRGEQSSRVSDPVVIDNTAPTIGDLNWHAAGQNKVQVDLRAVDRTTTIAAVEYAVDAAKDWQLVLPSDSIFDSPEEAVSFTADGLTPGQHQIAVRATDAKGNVAYQSVLVTVESPAAGANE